MKKNFKSDLLFLLELAKYVLCGFMLCGATYGFIVLFLLALK